MEFRFSNEFGDRRLCSFIGGAIGGIIGAIGASSAADTQASAANAASAAELSMFNQTQTNLQPWMQAGQVALSDLMALLGMGPGASAAPAAAAPASPGTFPTQAGNVGAPTVPVIGPNGYPTNQPTIPNPYSNPSEGGMQAQIPNPYYNPSAPPPALAQPGPAPATGGGAAAAGGSPFNPSNILNSPLLRQFSAADFQRSPGYNFQLTQGLDAISNASAARGGAFSGNTLKELQTYGTGLANQDWWNAYNAFTGNQNRVISTLGGISSGGQNAAANLGGFATNVGAQIGANTIGAGNASAAGNIGVANALAGGFNSLSNAFLFSPQWGMNVPDFSGANIPWNPGQTFA